MGIHKADARAGQMPMFDKMHELFLVNESGLRKGAHQGEDLPTILKVAQRKFSDGIRVDGNDRLIEQFFQVTVILSKVIDPDGGIGQDDHASEAATRNGSQTLLAPAQTSQTSGALKRYQRLEPPPDQGCLFANPGQPGRFGQHFVINIECRSHAYKYA